VPLSCVTCHAPLVPLEWYWTDQPSTVTGALLRLVISMKSLV
jgi:hypothetical protein